jgi:putative transposase
LAGSDQHGAEPEFLLQKRRDKAAAKRSFPRLLAACLDPQHRIVTVRLRSDPAANGEIPELANVQHVFVKASARVSNRAENSHQPTREREHRMRGYRDPDRTRAFLPGFGPIRQHFALSEICCAHHTIETSLRTLCRMASFAAWHRVTWLTQDPSAF